MYCEIEGFGLASLHLLSVGPLAGSSLSYVGDCLYGLWPSLEKLALGGEFPRVSYSAWGLRLYHRLDPRILWSDLSPLVA